jgi:hypothetical protein
MLLKTSHLRRLPPQLTCQQQRLNVSCPSCVFLCLTRPWVQEGCLAMAHRKLPCLHNMCMHCLLRLGLASIEHSSTMRAIDRCKFKVSGGSHHGALGNLTLVSQQLLWM